VNSLQSPCVTRPVFRSAAPGSSAVVHATVPELPLFRFVTSTMENNNNHDAGEEEVLVRDMHFELDEEILLKLLSNDPSINCVSIYTNISNFDWLANGSAIGENTCLRSLRVEFGGDDGDDMENLLAFYNAISRNRSIVSLSLQMNPINDAEVVDGLRPFFEHNHNLRRFVVQDVEISEEFAQSLVSALSKCKLLQELGIWGGWHDDDYNDDAAVLIIDSLLQAQPDLRRLDYNNGIGGSRPCGALSRLLKNPAVRLEELSLDQNLIDDGGAIILGNGLAENTTLKKISLEDSSSLTDNGWRELFSRWKTFSISMEELAISGEEFIDGEEISISDEGLGALARQFGPEAKLKVLRLANIEASAAGWLNFFNQLQASGCSSLENLSLHEITVDDEGASSMVGALANMRSLKSLNLSSTRFITMIGWHLIAGLLERPNCTLEEIELGNTEDINDEVVATFASSLANNSSLTKLGLSAAPTPQGWHALATTALFNNRDIGTVLASNHTLQEIAVSGRSVNVDMPNDVATFLRLNRSPNNVAVRQKLLRHYFSHGQSNMEDLVALEWQASPFAIAYIGKDILGFALLYQFVRQHHAELFA